jgi:hypothetical protein
MDTDDMTHENLSFLDLIIFLLVKVKWAFKTDRLEPMLLMDWSFKRFKMDVIIQRRGDKSPCFFFSVLVIAQICQ